MPDTFPDEEAMRTTSMTNAPVADDSSANLRMGWLLPLLLLVLAAGLFFYFKSGSGNSTPAVAPLVIQPADTVVDKKAPLLPDSTRQ